MLRVNLETAPSGVKEFLTALPLGPDGVELALNGKVVLKVTGAGQASDVEADWSDLERDAISSERIDAIAAFLKKSGQASA